MCIKDCFMKHFWRIVAIFFIFTTIGLSIGWGVSKCDENTGGGTDGYEMSPKIGKGTYHD